MVLPRWVRICDGLVCALIVLSLAVVLFGPFRLTVAHTRLVSISSAERVLLWAALVAAVRHLLEPKFPLPRRIHAAILTQPTRLASAAYVGVAVLFLHALTRYYQPWIGFTPLVQFGDHFDERALAAVRAVPHYVHEESWGYDGQFYAQLAVDPLLRDPALSTAIDAPAFRARRILFSWSAYVLGLGRPHRILQVYAAQNIACWFLLAWVLLEWFPPGSARNLCGWFACLFTSGSILSVLRALTDAPSMLLIALAVKAVERNRAWVASAILGLSGLGRETNVLAGAMLAPVRLQRSSMLRLFALACIVVLPLLLWTQYVYAVFHKYDGGRRAFSIPFTMYVTKWQTTLINLGDWGWGSSARYSLYALVSLTVEALYLAWRLEWKNPWWRVGAMYAALMFVLGPAVWEGDPGAVTRVLLPLPFAFNVLLVGDKWFWPLFVLGNLTVLHGVGAIELFPLSTYL